MDHIVSLGSLAMSSRLKRLADKIFQDVLEIYRLQDVDFEPKWFPVFHLLETEGKLAIGEIASKLCITHPAVNLTVNELEKKGYVNSSANKSDARKRMVVLSAKGKRLSIQLKPIWREIRAAADDLIADAGGTFLKELEKIESKLATKTVKQRMIDLKNSNKTNRSTILPHSAQYDADFLRLNRNWIEKFFKLEIADLRVLENPQTEIIDKGGAIFFAQIDEVIVGTCAILNMGDGLFELAKMGVDETYQNRGIGFDLITACIAAAKQSNAKMITLETNSSLKPAITLYKKCGFVEVKALSHDTEYERADYFMQLDLSTTPY